MKAKKSPNTFPFKLWWLCNQCTVYEYENAQFFLSKQIIALLMDKVDMYCLKNKQGTIPLVAKCLYSQHVVFFKNVTNLIAASFERM